MESRQTNHTGAQINEFPLVSVTMITHNHKDDTKKSIEEIRKTTYPNWEMIVVDNDSGDGLPEMIKTEYPWIKLTELHENRPFYAREISFRQAQGKYIVMLDDDSYPEPDAIGEMVKRFGQDPCLGIIAFHIPCGNLFSTAKWPETSAWKNTLFLACGAGITKELFAKLENHWADEIMELYGDERDFTLRAFAAGYTLGHFKNIVVHHRQRAGDQKRNNRFAYLAARNRLYLFGKYLSPSLWPALYIRHIFYWTIKTRHQLGMQSALWNIWGSIFGAHYIWEGYRHKKNLPDFVERAAYQNFAHIPITRFCLKSSARKRILNSFHEKNTNHPLCGLNLYSAQPKNFKPTLSGARKAFAQIINKFFITRNRQPEDLTKINMFLTKEMHLFKENFWKEILKIKNMQLWLEKLEKELHTGR